MTEENKDSKKQNGEKTLKLNDVKDFTVEEIVEKSKRVDHENRTNESVLDKYIRQHRSQIEDAKSKGLENYIRGEREKLENHGKVQADTEDKVEEVSNSAQEEIQQEKEISPVEEKETPIDQVKTEAEQEKVEQTNEKLPVVEDEIKEEINQPEISEVEADKIPEEKKVKTSEKEEADISEETRVFSPVDLKTDTEKSSEQTDVEEESEPIAPTETPETFDKVEVVGEKEETVKPAVSAIVPPVDEDKKFPELTSSPVLAPKEDKAEFYDKKVQDLAFENSDESEKKNHKVPIIIGLCALVLIAAGGIYAISNNNSNKNQPINTSSSSSSKKALIDDFNKDYQAFFTDSKKTALKNSQFAKLADLKVKLDKISDSADKSKVKSDYDELKVEIDAINLVNGLFGSPAIVDGKLNQESKVKADVKVPDAPKTKNESLNKLLADALALAKKQADANAQSKSSSSSNNSANNTSNTNTGNTDTGSNTGETNNGSTTENNPTVSDNSGTNSNANSADNGLNASGVNLDNSDARVQPQANLDLSDPAFVWADGVKEKVLGIARQRGYISGNDFYLVPVAIHTTSGAAGPKGGPAGIRSGYYNLYRPDGTYLMTINCRTGYFVGNGAGNADLLDF